MTVAVIDSGSTTPPQLSRAGCWTATTSSTRRDGTLDCAGHGTAVASIVARARPGPGSASAGSRRGEDPAGAGQRQQVVDGGSRGARSAPGAVRPGHPLGGRPRRRRDQPLGRALRGQPGGPRGDRARGRRGRRRGRRRRQPPRQRRPASLSRPPTTGCSGWARSAPTGCGAQFSQIGPYVDLVAPGGDVLVAAPGQGHQRPEGTSYAAPFVAATAALIREYWPGAARGAGGEPDPRHHRSGARRRAQRRLRRGVLNPYRAVTETRAAGPARRPRRSRPSGSTRRVVAQRARRATARAPRAAVAGVARRRWRRWRCCWPSCCPRGRADAGGPPSRRSRPLARRCGAAGHPRGWPRGRRGLGGRAPARACEPARNSDRRHPSSDGAARRPGRLGAVRPTGRDAHWNRSVFRFSVSR